ncbi:hypothetical protein [Treponema sp. R6D11]
MIKIFINMEDYKLRKHLKNIKISFFLVFTVFLSLTPVYAQRAPIDVNLIIDGSSSLATVKNEVTAWVSGRLDQILTEGDRVTVWSAGAQSKVIYTGKIEGPSGKDAVKKSISDLAPTGNRPDFSGALRDAASRKSLSYSYTLLISASPAALTSVLLSPQANLLRFSRIEEFPDWRALVVGLNIDAKVKSSATAFFAQ